MSALIEATLDGALARITLNRPEQGNAIDQALADRLLELAHWCDSEKAVRAILITANGKMFCAGGDVSAFAAAGSALPTFVRNLTASLHMAIARFAALSKPVVVAVNGPVAGAGLGVALVGDLVYAAPSAQFVLAYPKIGLSPDAAATWLLPKLIGLRRTQRMIFEARAIDAEEAVAIGLITSAFASQDAMMAHAERTVANLAAMPTKALGRSKKLLLRANDRAIEAQLEEEASAIALCAGEPDSGEGVRAFLDKRAAVFHGQ